MKKSVLIFMAFLALAASRPDITFAGDEAKVDHYQAELNSYLASK